MSLQHGVTLASNDAAETPLLRRLSVSDDLAFYSQQKACRWPRFVTIAAFLIIVTEGVFHLAPEMKRCWK